MLSDQLQPVSLEDRIAAGAEASRLEVGNEHRRIDFSDLWLRETPEIELPVREDPVLQVEGPAQLEDTPPKECRLWQMLETVNFHGVKAPS